MKGRRTLLNFPSLEGFTKECERFKRELENALSRTWKAYNAAQELIASIAGRPDAFAVAEDFVSPERLEARYAEALDRIESYIAFLDQAPSLIELLEREIGNLRAFALNAEGFPVQAFDYSERRFYVAIGESVEGPFLREHGEGSADVEAKHAGARLAWFDTVSEARAFTELSPEEARKETDPPDF